MITSFRCDDTKAVFGGKQARTFQSIGRVAFRKLAQLDSATSLHDLKSPGNSLEKLHGDREGQHSIRVNEQYRICFEWDGNNASNVEIVDYH